ncbi:MAG: GatB/YqeY domain-containing protein [Gammaproteobacteria bacterium]|nr:GatB/YqeY domain-containing protein [Gammaproteobacteria bacterium]
MSLKQSIMEATKAAMKEKDKARLIVLRSFSAAVKQREIDEQIELDEANQMAVLDKLIKQRKDSESQFRDANREDLADKEAYEISVLSAFLPKQLEESEINEIIDAAIASVDASGMAAMGKVMAVVKPQVQGKADIGKVSQLVKSKL